MHYTKLFILSDSIREFLGRRVKLYIKRMVKQEVRLDKWENRVVVSYLIIIPSNTQLHFVLSHSQLTCIEFIANYQIKLYCPMKSVIYLWQYTINDLMIRLTGWFINPEEEAIITEANFSMNWLFIFSCIHYNIPCLWFSIRFYLGCAYGFQY